MTWEVFVAIMTMPADELDRRIALIRDLVGQYYQDVEDEYGQLLRDLPDRELTPATPANLTRIQKKVHKRAGRRQLAPHALAN